MSLKSKIIDFQLALLNFFKSKTFIFLVILVLLALFINLFTSNDKLDVNMNFNKNDQQELDDVAQKVEEEYQVTMAEVNRNAKLVNSFFKEVIVDKMYNVYGISSDYENITDYEMQITDIRKTEKGYDVLLQILIRDYDKEERTYVPYKIYLVNVLSTNTGLKVDYITKLD